MHAIYLINGTSGDVIWTLGGKGNDFTELPYPEGKEFSSSMLTMSWQHHATFYPGSDEREITVFDNHVIDGNLAATGYTDCIPGLCSRGIHIRIDTESGTVQLLQEYLHPAGLASVSQGSVQVLDNGNVFIGWGRNPAFTEHTPDGEVVFDVQFGPWRIYPDRDEGLDNYRAFKLDWYGMPYWNPDIAVQRHGENGDVDAWVSWNGATEVDRWVLLASDSADDLDGANKTVAFAEREGFETHIFLASLDAGYVRAAALNEAGDVIGSTGIADLNSGVISAAEYPVTEVEQPEMPVAASETVVFAMEQADWYEWDSSATGLILRMAGFAFGIWILKKVF